MPARLHGLVFLRASSGLAITDPYLIYKSQVARGLLRKDLAQLRAAKEFQSLYWRLKDYTPPKKAEIELRTIVRDLEAKYEGNRYIEGFLPKWWTDMNKIRASKKLVKVLTNEEELKDLKIPKGFLLNGEVGCGKSMLMDMFADSLPYASKGRWHYHNFMLWVYEQIHTIQKRRSMSNKYLNHLILGLENELVLFEIASNMIRKNTVLLLDELALPDIAAAKIVKTLFTYFFKLGGVLVATSNRLPEDLYATDFRKREFRSFLSVLEMRCDTLDMDSQNDYRKILSQGSDSNLRLIVYDGDEKEWETAVFNLIGDKKGSEDQLKVYGRDVLVPWHAEGIVIFDFDYICRGLFGPADYISLASKYHTFVIDNVPVFKVSMKSEARRFITLLDALYESKCQLLLKVDAPLEGLFFPDSEDEGGSNMAQVQQEEMYLRTQLDMMSPYRPNVSEYGDGELEFRDQMNMKHREETDFTKTNKFTGEDEKFAYKRAVSRIEEMTKSQSWRTTKQWSPIHEDFRMWEKSRGYEDDPLMKSGVDVAKKEAPEFSDNHFWSVGLWGKGKRLKDEFAKRWIRGADGKV